MKELVELLVAEIPNLSRVGLIAEKASSQAAGSKDLALWDHFRGILHAMAKATHHIEEARKSVVLAEEVEG